jgi:hypothetical protein
MEEKKYTFNEKELEQFLNDTDTANTFEMVFKKEDHKASESVMIMKMYDPSKEYALVYSVDAIRMENLAFVQKNQRFHYIGIYLKNANCLVFETTYYYKKMVGANRSLRVLTEENVYDTVHTKVNLSLLNRKEDFLAKFPFEEKAVQNKLEEWKNEIYRKVVLGMKICNFDIHPTTFNRYHSLEMVKQYLTEGGGYIERFVDSFVDKNENTIQHFCLLDYAIRVYVPKLEEDLDVLKAKRVHHLLKEQVPNAKSIWAVTIDDVKVKVPSLLRIFDEEVQLGDASTYLNLDEVVAIEYMKKRYEIDSEYTLLV